MSGDVFLLTVAVVIGIAVAFGLILLLGLILRHIVTPIHDKIWNHKRKKERNIFRLKELFMDGLFLLIMMLWLPFISILAVGSAYVAIVSISEGNVLNSILGIALTLFFASKLFFMLEHRSHAKKRWKSKRKK